MRRITQICCLLALLFVGGCDFARGQWSEFKEGYREATTAPREINRGAKPEVIVNGNDITIDGQPLRLGADAQEWVDVLGSGFRKHYRAFIWDEKGLSALPYPNDENKVVALSVTLNFKQSSSQGEPAHEELRSGGNHVPKEPFKGYLEINGLAVDAQSTIRETNLRSNGELSIRCSKGINICSDSIGRGEDAPLLYFEVDGREEESVIYDVQVGLYPYN
jgi:hypothetical protein